MHSELRREQLLNVDEESKVDVIGKVRARGRKCRKLTAICTNLFAVNDKERQESRLASTAILSENNVMREVRYEGS